MKTCDLPADTLPRFVAGTLPPAEAAGVTCHLDVCAGCRAEADAWRAIAGAVRAEDLAAAAPLPSLGPVLAAIAREAAGDAAAGEAAVGDAAAPARAAIHRANGSRGWAGPVGWLALMLLLGLAGLAGRVATGSWPGGGGDGGDGWTSGRRLASPAGRGGATAVPRVVTPGLVARAPGARELDPGVGMAPAPIGGRRGGVAPAVPVEGARAGDGSGRGALLGRGWTGTAIDVPEHLATRASASSAHASTATAVRAGSSTRTTAEAPVVEPPIRIPRTTPPAAWTATEVPTGTPAAGGTPTGSPTGTPVRAAPPSATTLPTPDGGIVAGRVLGPDGQPRAEIPVRAWRVGAALGDAVESLPAADGSFQMALPPGAWLIGVLSPAHQPVWWRGGGAAAAACPLAAAPIDLAAGQAVAGVDFTLARLPDQRVVGRVVDGAGRPLAGAMLVAAPPGGADPAAWGPVAFADGDGRYALALEPGTYVVGAAQAWTGRPGLWWDGAAGVEQARPITVEPGADVVADFALPGR